eukprot:TRINITY_DN5522_c0_g1_i3.p1 TRINITY_DN5522_c0_g1~~TRINITY_DN5522_c0_g1_i3.p1  ORF type:complete len:1003 (-),score=207.84 TRINITY_DN5522_c0_g1_i3:40-2820(-)
MEEDGEVPAPPPPMPPPPAAVNVSAEMYGESWRLLRSLGLTDAHSAGHYGADVDILIIATDFGGLPQSVDTSSILMQHDFLEDDDDVVEGSATGIGSSMVSVLLSKAEQKVFGGAPRARLALADVGRVEQGKRRRVGRAQHSSAVEKEMTSARRGSGDGGGGGEERERGAIGSAYDDRVAAAIQWGSVRGVHMVVVAGGDATGDEYPFPSLDGKTWASSIAASAAVESGIIVVAAAGDSGELDILVPPADSAGVIAVGSLSSLVTASPQQSLSAFSPAHSYTYDGRAKPDLVVPGEAVAVERADGSVAYADGTSVAAAVFTGMAAVVRSARADEWPPARDVALHCYEASDGPRTAIGVGCGVPNVLRVLSSSVDAPKHVHGECNVEWMCECDEDYYGPTCSDRFHACPEFCSDSFCSEQEHCLCDHWEGSHCVEDLPSGFVLFALDSGDNLFRLPSTALEGFYGAGWGRRESRAVAAPVGRRVMPQPYDTPLERHFTRQCAPFTFFAASHNELYMTPECDDVVVLREGQVDRTLHCIDVHQYTTIAVDEGRNALYWLSSDMERVMRASTHCSFEAVWWEPGGALFPWLGLDHENGDVYFVQGSDDDFTLYRNGSPLFGINELAFQHRSACQIAFDSRRKEVVFAINRPDDDASYVVRRNVLTREVDVLHVPRMDEVRHVFVSPRSSTAYIFNGSHVSAVTAYGRRRNYALGFYDGHTHARLSTTILPSECEYDCFGNGLCMEGECECDHAMDSKCQYMCDDAVDCHGHGHCTFDEATSSGALDPDIDYSAQLLCECDEINYDSADSCGSLIYAYPEIFPDVAARAYVHTEVHNARGGGSNWVAVLENSYPPLFDPWSPWLPAPGMPNPNKDIRSEWPFMDVGLNDDELVAFCRGPTYNVTYIYEVDGGTVPPRDSALLFFLCSHAH